MVKKRHIRILSLAIAFVFLFSSVAMAAIPVNSVILNDKAYSVEYLMDPANLQEINEQAAAASDSGNLFYNLEGQTDGWYGIMTQQPVSDEDLAALPEIEYKDAEGNVTRYAAGNGDPVSDELTVESVSAIEPINVANGTAQADIGLPAEVEITLSDDTKVTVPVSWACDNYDPATAGTYTFVGTLDLSGLENVAATDKTASVDVVVAEAQLAVESVSAINGTTVEVAFNKDVTAEDGLTFSFDGAAVAAENVAYSANKATLTVATMKDDSVNANGYAVVVTGSEGTELYNGTITYDMNRATTLEVAQEVINQQVFSDAAVVFTLKDEDGDVMAGEQVYVTVAPQLRPDDPDPATLTTNENGQVTYTFSRNEVPPGADTITAYPVSRPSVTATATVNWTLAESGLVNVDSVAKTTIGDYTWKTFTVTAKTEDGANFVGRLNMDLAFNNGTVGDLTVEAYDPAAETWTKTITQSGVQFGVNLVAADNGQVKIRIRNDVTGNDVDLIPTFWYASPIPASATALGTVETMDTNDPNVVGAQVIWEDQVASVSIDAASDSTISTADTATYTVRVVDQYGNPYRGSDVTVDFVENHDNLVGTTAGTSQVDIDYDEDGTGDEGVGNDVVADLSVATGNTGAEDGVFNVIVSGNDGDSGTLLVWVDSDADSVVGEDETEVSGAKTSFEDPVITSITITNPETLEIAAGANSQIFEVKLYDQFGEAIDSTATGALDLEFALSDATGSATLEVDLDNDSTASSWDAEAVGATSYSNVGTAVAPLNAYSDTILVKICGGAVDEKQKFTVWAEANPGDDALQSDEVSAESAEVTFVGNVLSAGEIYDVTATAGENVVSFDEGSFDYYVTGGSDKVTVSYAVKDQGDQYLDLSSAVDVVFTVQNTGENDISVDDGSGNVTVAAGETKEFTVTTADATIGTVTADAASIEITGSGSEDTVKVSAQVKGKADTASEVNLLFETTTMAGDQTYNGNVIALTTNTGTNDGGKVLLQTTMGNVLVEYDDTTTFDGIISFKVDGNTANESLFEGNISVGDAVSVESGDLDGNTTTTNTDLKVLLTNN